MNRETAVILVLLLLLFAGLGITLSYVENNSGGITANSCSGSSVAYGINATGGLSCVTPFTAMGLLQSGTCEIQNTSTVMAGFKTSFTASANSVLITANFNAIPTVASISGYLIMYLWVGTGKEPTCLESSGTPSVVCGSQEWVQYQTVASTDAFIESLSLACSLHVGTTYWIDIRAAVNSAMSPWYIEQGQFALAE